MEFFVEKPYIFYVLIRTSASVTLLPHSLDNGNFDMLFSKEGTWVEYRSLLKYFEANNFRTGMFTVNYATTLKGRKRYSCIIL